MHACRNQIVNPFIGRLLDSAIFTRKRGTPSKSLSLLSTESLVEYSTFYELSTYINLSHSRYLSHNLKELLVHIHAIIVPLK